MEASQKEQQEWQQCCIGRKSAAPVVAGCGGMVQASTTAQLPPLTISKNGVPVRQNDAVARVTGNAATFQPP